jgi:septal ring factor EnvC (AmiA/AmiB activator)
MFIRRQILRAGVGPRVGARAGEVRLRKEHMLGADWAGAGPDFDRRKGVRRSAFLAGLAAAATFASFLGLGTVLAADNANPNPNPNSGVTQPAPAKDAADAKIKEREQRLRELQGVEQSIQQSDAERQRIEDEIAGLKADREKLRRDLVVAADKVRAL